MLVIEANFAAGVGLDVAVDFCFIRFQLPDSIPKHTGHSICLFHGIAVGKGVVSLG
jgi:hypothetical protein